MMRNAFLKTVATGAAFALTLCTAAPALADPFPERPIKLVVPYSPGGIADSLARRLAESLRQDLQQPVIVENKPGANTAIGAIAVASAPADGYTLLMATAATVVLNPMLIAKLRYQPEKDFTGVANVALTPLVLSVNPAGPIHSMADLVRLAKAEPGKLAFASTGTGSSTHLAAEMLQSEAGITMNHVPYNGSAPALNAVMAGDVQLSVDAVASAMALVKGDKLRPIAVTTRERVGVLPQVPTVAESGLPNYNVSTWYGIVAPAATPTAVLQRLNEAIVKTTKDKAFRAQFEALGLVMAPPLKPAEFDAFIGRERALWDPLIKTKNIRIE
ncbi:Bug family tripartite tricarboxylate transporter substrate binding protein [Variovorax sp. RT4R15]|uniref:Bug family tripartite tricarboxylate transporter substrate binding protein n=1 Tax=Variovorax sp. RT4R15 TaxID=3443737 RepID=UPI003F453646